MGYYRDLNIVMKKELANEFFDEFSVDHEDGNKSKLWNCEIDKSDDGEFTHLYFAYEKGAGVETDNWFDSLPDERLDDFIALENNEFDEHLCRGRLYDNPFGIGPIIEVSCQNAREGIKDTLDELGKIFGKDAVDAALDDIMSERQGMSAGMNQ